MGQLTPGIVGQLMNENCWWKRNEKTQVMPQVAKRRAQSKVGKRQDMYWKVKVKNFPCHLRLVEKHIK